MKSQADCHRKNYEFQPDNWVFLKLQPFRQQSLAQHKIRKLSLRYFGQFKIIKKNPIAYQVELPQHSKIYLVFHVSLFKPYKGTIRQLLIARPEPGKDSTKILKPQAVLDRREVEEGENKMEQVLGQWEGLLQEDTTWISLFDLEDKVSVEGERDDTITYTITKATYGSGAETLVIPYEE